MKIINWLVNKYILGGLIFSSFVALAVAVLHILFIVFNFNPYYEHKSDNSTFSFGYNLKKGFPITIDVNSMPNFDTTVCFLTDQNESGGYKLNLPRPNIKGSIIKADTFSVVLEKNNWDQVGLENKQRDAQLSELSFPTFTLFIKPNTKLQVFIFLLPAIIGYLIYAYVANQFAKFLHYIQIKETFNYINFKRLNNIGFSIIISTLFIYIYSFIVYRYNVSISFQSTLSKWHGSMFYLSGSPTSSGLGYYFLFGCVCIVIAKAFKRGFELQQEQDLTV